MLLFSSHTIKKDAHDMSVCVNCFMAQQPSFSCISPLLVVGST